MDVTTRPLAFAPYPLAQSALHRILVCKACNHHVQTCEPGFRPLKQQRAAVPSAGLGAVFDVSGTACLAGCVPDSGGECVVGWRANANAKAKWLFGDIDPARPIDDVWLSGKTLPQRLCDTPLARIPAAMIVTWEGVIQ